MSRQPGVTDHEHMPEDDSVYREGPSSAGLPGDAGNVLHYPLTAVCRRCRHVIRCESPRQRGWADTGRVAGDSL